MRRAIRWVLGGAALLAVAFFGSWLYSMPSAAERGVWRHEADGQILHLTRTEAQLYHQTEAACLPGLAFPAHLALVRAMEGAWIEVEGDNLALHIDGNVAPQRFNRAAALPDACLGPPDASPAATFAAMWTVMNAHYAFFDLHGVDWDARRAFAPQPGEAMSDAELFARMQSALSGLDDGHIQLLAGEMGFYTPAMPPGWMPDPPLSRTALNEIARQTMDMPLTAVEQTGLQYGLRPDGIGYLLITRMSTEPGFGQLGTEVAERAFAEVATALGDARAIILDIRYNPGGDDGTALAYASYFTDTPFVALTKRTRDGAGWTDSVEAIVTPAPADLRLTAPVLLLTSRLTGSGAEIFTMALRSRPQVTVMGEPTGGGLSDILGVTLPNGWQLGLSNQEYRTADGVLYEATGLPPDVAVPTDGAALARGEDPVLRAALDWAMAQN